jgi:hypothetical protein
MNHMREGGCQCGAIRYSIDKQPRLTFACHCTDCQSRSGSEVVFPVCAFVTKQKTELLNMNEGFQMNFLNFKNNIP